MIPHCRCLSTAWFISYRYSGFALSGQTAGYRGQLPAPLKIIALVILSVAAIVWPGVLSARRLRLIKTLRFLTASQRLSDHGYAGRDGIWYRYCYAARSRGVTEARLLTRYTVWVA